MQRAREGVVVSEFEDGIGRCPEPFKVAPPEQASHTIAARESGRLAAELGCGIGRVRSGKG